MNERNQCSYNTYEMQENKEKISLVNKDHRTGYIEE